MTTPITNAAFAQSLAVIIAQFKADRISVDQAVAQLTTLANNWTVGAVTPPQLGIQMSQALGNWNNFTSGQLEFFTAAPTGGPHGNGTVDMTDYLGNVTTIPGLQLLQQLIARGDAGGYVFQFSTATADADPGAGKAAYNNATIASVTEVFVHDSALIGTDVTAWLAVIGVSTNASTKGQLFIQDSTTGAIAVFRVTGPSVSATGYYKVPVAYMAGAEAANGDRLSLLFAPAGDSGGTFSYGTGAPGSGVGNIGDVYINVTTGDFYGPKSISGWGSPTASGLTGYVSAAAASATAAAISSAAFLLQPGTAQYIVTDPAGNALFEITPTLVNHPDTNTMRTELASHAASLATDAAEIAALQVSTPIGSPGVSGFIITDPAGNALMQVAPAVINHPDTNAMRAQVSANTTGLAALQAGAPVARPGFGEFVVTDAAGNALMEVTPTTLNHPEANSWRPKIATLHAPVVAIHGNDWIAFDGDSQTAQDYSVTSTLIQRNARGFGTQFMIQARGKYRTNASLNFGVGGATTASLLARQLTTNIPAMQSAGCLDVVLKIGTNDAALIGLGTLTLAQHKTQLLQIIQNYLNVGVRVRLSIPLPRSAATGTTSYINWPMTSTQATNAVKALAAIRRFQRSLQFLEPGRLVIGDAFRYVVDWTSSADDPKGAGVTGGDFQDGTHANNGRGPWWEGYALLQADVAFGQQNEDLGLSNAAYDATYNPTGNRLSDGRLQTTGGTLAGSATGIVPAAATLTKGSANISSAVGSQAAAPAGQNGIAYQLDVAGGAVGGSSTIQTATLSWPLTVFTVGETLEGNVEASLSNLSNNGGLVFSVSYFDGSSTLLLKVQTSESSLHADQSFTGLWQLDAHTVPTGAASATVSVSLGVDVSVASTARAQITGLTIHSPAS